ncbi:MAG: hypothetical protein DRJ03_16515 [Chloroflexi bacterium]|nr:MAG: hypothetical protein DRJ03_16515 [Chloroflexota bacterium]
MAKKAVAKPDISSVKVRTNTVTVRFTEAYRNGTILPDTYRAGQIIKVTPQQLQLLKADNPHIVELLDVKS